MYYYYVRLPTKIVVKPIIVFVDERKLSENNYKANSNNQ